jgi:hypothetical protein
MSDKICKWFACVYATKNGCVINGWMDKEGELNGKKEHCSIYDVMCITAKCKACGHGGTDVCEKALSEVNK